METIEFRVAVISADTRKIMSVQTSDGHGLPSVIIPVVGRVAELLQTAMDTTWGVHILLLKTLEAEDGFPPCVIAEQLVAPNNSAFSMICLDSLAVSAIHDRQRSQLAALITGDSVTRFTRIGWIDEAIRWVEASVGSQVSSKRCIQQFGVGENSALLRFQTVSSQFIWMKATGHTQEHELALTSLLSHLSPGHLPKCFGTRSSWNAWLTDGGPSKGIAHTKAIEQMDVVAQSLAELQMNTVEWGEELLAAGAIDQRSATLRRQVPMVFEYLEEAMLLPIEGQARRLDVARVRELCEMFSNIFDRLETINLPDAVLHGDFHLDNIVSTPHGYQFIDWCEGYFGMPLIAFQHLLLLHRSDRAGADSCIEDALWLRYCEPWKRRCSAEVLEHAVVYMPIVAAFSALYGRGDWLTGPERDQPRVQKYARNLTRIMNSAAGSPALLQALETKTYRYLA